MIEPMVAAHVLYAYGEGGIQAGSFTQALIVAAQLADPENVARLAMGFPGYISAVRLAQNDFGGIAILKAIAAGEIPG